MPTEPEEHRHATAINEWFIRNRSCLQLSLTAFLASGITAFLSFAISGGGQLLYLWPVTGVLLGILLPGWKGCKSHKPSLIAGALGVLLGDMLAGIPFWFALVCSAVCAVEIGVSGLVLSRKIQTFEDMKQRANLVPFAMVAIGGPLGAAVVLGLPLQWVTQVGYSSTVLSVFLADSLGVVVLFPLVLLVMGVDSAAWSRMLPNRGKALVSAAVFTAVVLYVFWQTGNPFLFMVYPPMVILLLFTGLEGSVFISLVLVAVGCVATVHDHGPMALLALGNLSQRRVDLQVFLWMSVMTALPISTLLDERRRAEQAANEFRSLYTILLQYADDMIIQSSIDGVHRYMSAACEKLTGWTAKEFLELDRMSVIHPDDRDMVQWVIESLKAGKLHHRFRYRIARKSGGWVWVEAVGEGYMDRDTKEAAGYVVTVRDITELRITEQERDKLALNSEKMSQLALIDSLTGLLNRRGFDGAFERQIKASASGGQPAALLMIDVDHFKRYNDAYGHQMGDQCLFRIAAALQRSMGRGTDVLARWGGEEFVVLLAGADVGGAKRVAQNLLTTVMGLGIQQRDGSSQPVTVSVGIAPLDAATLAEPRLWIQQADLALYESKRRGRNCATLSTELTVTK